MARRRILQSRLYQKGIFPRFKSLWTLSDDESSSWEMNRAKLSLNGFVGFSSVPSPKFGGNKYFDCKRATVFCLGHRLTKHKTTRYARICLRGHDPLALPVTLMVGLASIRLSNIVLARKNVSKMFCSRWAMLHQLFCSSEKLVGFRQHFQFRLRASRTTGGPSKPLSRLLNNVISSFLSFVGLHFIFLPCSLFRLNTNVLAVIRSVPRSEGYLYSTNHKVTFQWRAIIFVWAENNLQSKFS